MKIKVAEAGGIVLDWMVAKCEGLTPTLHKNPYGYWVMPNIPGSYSTDWSQGGPIIDQADIDILRGSDEKFIARLASARMHPQRDALSYFPQTGTTKLIAAMRCFCSSRLGDEVDVPEELS